MELCLSLHEVVTKCTQALRALNVPPGLDIENGKNIGWLESRGLPGLQMLVEEIKAASDNTNRSPIELNIIQDTVQFSSQGYSAFNFTQSAVDFSENGKIVSVEKCRFPLLIFAEMARRKHLPFGFHVQWIKDDEINTGAAISGNSEITINSGSLTEVYSLEITAIKDLIIKNPLIKLSHESTFEGNGISCDRDYWKVICATAKKVLVPDSERSHSSAGAEVDDSN
tara:strand:+ start:439 stop:1116 length:678 start_codon:yes stop_codon:yes gene_type:complete